MLYVYCGFLTFLCLQFNVCILSGFFFSIFEVDAFRWSFQSRLTGLIIKLFLFKLGKYEVDLKIFQWFKGCMSDNSVFCFLRHNKLRFLILFEIRPWCCLTATYVLHDMLYQCKIQCVYQQRLRSHFLLTFLSFNFLYFSLV